MLPTDSLRKFLGSMSREENTEIGTDHSQWTVCVYLERLHPTKNLEYNDLLDMKIGNEYNTEYK